MSSKHHSPEGTGNVATECKHRCKDKKTCGHPCCKRHLSPIVQLKAAQRLSGEPASKSVECRHTCRDKLACGHQCCKRHLSREATETVAKQQPSLNLQVVKQATRKSQLPTTTHSIHQVRRASSGPLLGVQGRAVAKTQEEPQATTPVDKPKFHFFIYDIESTGLSPTGDRMVEIAMKDSASYLEYSTLVSCAPATVHRGAYQAHGISTRQSHEHGLPFKQVAAQLVQFINKGTEADEVPVLVAHNGKNFDNRMLTAEYKRCGVSLPEMWQWLDTLPLARNLLPELTRHSQADVRAFLELPPPRVAHRAAADVAILHEIVKGLARLAGVGSLEGLMTLDGVHKGSFRTYAGISLKEHQVGR
ncbi:TPA: hypothetical protein ACH3X1_000283 [Trebouxia sp. C0004]